MDFSKMTDSCNTRIEEIKERISQTNLKERMMGLMGHSQGETDELKMLNMRLRSVMLEKKVYKLLPFKSNQDGEKALDHLDANIKTIKVLIALSDKVFHNDTFSLFPESEWNSQKEGLDSQLEYITTLRNIFQ